ncbi:MAG: Mitochondrial presequence protease [Alyxoria varia]|nr:MAG: Mitochondrial presequence protease [Alyxoria varia]
MRLASHKRAHNLGRIFGRTGRLPISYHGRKYATIAEDTPKADSIPHPGDSLHGFTVRRVREVPELELTALHFLHEKTGAEYLHLAKDDKNNVFSIGFKTNPTDRTGLPHILEHLTLCGSKKYPIRDPFFKMMPRSLNNFMNAMTYPDHTAYPFATTNHQDFRNLMSIYLDATLHPLLRKHDFAQEGWRIGPQDPHAASSSDNPLTFKGVVYNEMKGNVSNADYLFRQRWQDKIMPSLNDSGGDPSKMTDLTYEQLKEYREDHYNPSNAKLLTYGNMPFIEHLKQLGPELDRFGRVNVDEDLKMPISLSSGSRTITVPGPRDPLYPKDEQWKASITWMMCDTSEILETFSLNLISSLLLDGYSSPIHRNTIGIGWGASYTPNTGFDASNKMATFTVGLSGLTNHDLLKLEDGMKNTLKFVRRTGFDMEKINGRLHQIELGLKHKTAQFGMGIVTRLQDGWFNGIDPFSAISPEEVIDAFRAKMDDQYYLIDLFNKYWLTDKTFTFVMEPTSDFSENLEKDESKRLSTKIDEFTKQFPNPDEAIQALEKQEKDLVTVQEQGGAEDLSCLPTIHVKDISRKHDRKPVRHSSVGETKVQWREAPTNGLTYFRAVQTLQDLPDELRIYLPLFTAATQRLGTNKLTVESLEDQQRLHTGGIGLGHNVSTSPLNLDNCTEGLSFSGTAFDFKVPQMLELLQTIARETNFDKPDTEEKISELIKGSANTAISDVAETGHSYARKFAEAGLSPHARISEELDGLTQVRLMMDLAARSEREGLGDVVDKLKVIQQFVLAGGSQLRVALTCGPEARSDNEQALRNFLERLPSSASVMPPRSEEQVPYPHDMKLFFPLPYQVYYAAQATRTVPYTHPESAALAVMAQLLTHKRLLPECREKGGVYGASSYLSPLKGTFGFATYRDPNPLNSLKVMAETGAWSAARQWTERDIEEAKLCVFQGVDAPESVSTEGMALFLKGVDDDMQQQRRERLLDVTAAQVRDVAGKYVVDMGAEVEDRGKNTVLIGERAEWIGEKDGWTEMPVSSGTAAKGNEDAGEIGEDGNLVVS